MDEHIQDLPLWNDTEAFSVLESLCKKHDVPVDVLQELVLVQRQNQHREKAKGIYGQFEEIFNRMD
ncbi:DNA modification system-associated small protein [Methylotuvimicrobium sp. KM2]|uniref:DNA modification system-associated small protein n=1 Tax=Methylotuvimicrobium sp. KM2 TaxID=3133976 RepID=UPI0031017BE4